MENVLKTIKRNERGYKMALDVRYDEIRTQVIAKLNDQKGEMEDILSKLESTVGEIPSHMEGDAAVAFVNEFDEIVKKIYTKLNINIGDFAAQLESVCSEFEKLDIEMQSQLS
jgi:WXG100 family type VII secretion target